MTSSSSPLCFLCSETINPQASIWTCNHCFTLYDLSCIQTHARKVKSGVSKLLRNVLHQYIPTWNCPSCQTVYSEESYPTDYRCFCQKTINPVYNPYLEPHSCGKLCSKKYLSCDHTCAQLCHPGPCDTCVATAEVSCFCRKETLKKRCGAAPFSCLQKCERVGLARYHPTSESTSTDEPSIILPDEQKYLRLCTHKCTSVCHDGSCPPCLLPLMNVPCECGSSKKTVPCFKRSWKCDRVCNKLLSCGHDQHYCTNVCHGSDTPCSVCPDADRSTDSSGDNTSFTDLPGMEQTEIYCRCGKKSKRKLGSNSESFTCDTRCTVIRNCQRHTCRKRCCKGLGPNPLYLKHEDTDVTDSSRTLTNGNDEDDEEYCPPCREICGLRRSCNNCIDESYCHSGPCLPCPKMVTVSFCQHAIYKVRCGEEKNVPPCTALCNVSYAACSHTCTARCHPNTPCGPCKVSVERRCVGDHETRTVPCSSPSLFKCSSLCNNTLACTKHTCERSCHKKLPSSSSSSALTKITNENEDESVTGETIMKGTGCGTKEDNQCYELCSELRTCNHPCATLPNHGCHPGPCTPCDVTITKFCFCRRDTKTYTCSTFQNLTNKERENGYSCQRLCSKFFNCGHPCSSLCHDGTCDEIDSCKKLTTVRCKCSKRKEPWLCNQINEKRKQLGISPFDPQKNLVLLQCDPQSCTKISIEEPILTNPVTTTNSDHPIVKPVVPVNNPSTATDASTLRNRKGKVIGKKSEATPGKTTTDSSNNYIYYAIGIIILIMVVYIFYKLLRLSLK